MKPVAGGVLALATLSWAVSGMPDAMAGFWAWRREAVLLTGYAALLLMAATMVLAMRLPWLEQRLGGLDTHYSLHRSLGIATGVMLMLHWASENAPKWAVAWGWLERRARGGHGGGPTLAHLAAELGEWAFYALLVLGAIALTRRVPWRWFRLSHRAFAVVALLAAFHAVVLMPARWTGTPAGIGVWLAALVVAAAACWSLAGQIGRAQRHAGRVTAVQRGPAGQLDVRIALAAPGMPFRAGQFALVRFDDDEGAHPFSLAAAGDDPAHLRLLVKPLGDYTRRLSQTLRAGQSVEVEGPYGRFDFAAGGEREVWVAGGIGIAPFVGRLAHLATRGGAGCPTTLVYCVATRAEAGFPADLADLCTAAGVQLVHHVDAEDGPVRVDSLIRRLGVQGECVVRVCGPAGLIDTLRMRCAEAGVPSARFHAERFAWR